MEKFVAKSVITIEDQQDILTHTLVSQPSEFDRDSDAEVERLLNE
jgi:hypothetical protein